MKKQLFLISTLCLSAQLFGAADAIDTIAMHNMIKVSKADESILQHELAFDRINDSKVFACLVADKHSKKDAATQTLAILKTLNFRIGPRGATQDQFAAIKQAIQPNAQWTIVFAVRRAPKRKRFADSIYTQEADSTAEFRAPLYCKLKNTGQTYLCMGEPGIAEIVWKDLRGFAPDELGFELDVTAIKQKKEDSTYAIAYIFNSKECS